MNKGDINMKLRFATVADSGALLKIYSQYIDTPITFEVTIPTEIEFANRIKNIRSSYPYIVCEDNGKIVGYAYAHRHMERDAYQWNAELSIYLDKDSTMRGLGKRMYYVLIEILKLQGIRTVYGCVTLPNKKSENLHKSLGFNELGTYHNTGYKSGKWHDVIWFGKTIGLYDIEPKSIISINEIREEELNLIFQKFIGVDKIY